MSGGACSDDAGSRKPRDTIATALHPALASADGRLPGQIRQRTEDFRVEEIAAFTPDGDGEHLMLWVEKRDLNTEQVARALARAAGVAAKDVGYAGLKDRRAVTRQWFSIPARARIGDAPDTVDDDRMCILERHRHRRKLRRGALLGNRFRILVRGETGSEPGRVLARSMDRIRAQGVPNYFGPQRFGRDAANVEQARALFAGRLARVSRHLRGLLISAARSALFNQVLARRVEDASWNRLLDGEAVMLDGRNSFFTADRIDAALGKRLAEFDVHPSGPLWGRGEAPVRGEAARIESEALASSSALRQGLEQVGLEQQRRSLRIRPGELSVEEVPGVGWWIAFQLSRGAYATAVLREAFVLDDAATGGAGSV